MNNELGVSRMNPGKRALTCLVLILTSASIIALTSCSDGFEAVGTSQVREADPRGDCSSYGMSLEQLEQILPEKEAAEAFRKQQEDCLSSE